MTPERASAIKLLALPVGYLALMAGESWWRTEWSWHTLLFGVTFVVVAAEMILGPPPRPVRKVVLEAGIRLFGLIVAFAASPLWLRVTGLLIFVIPVAISVVSWRRAQRSVELERGSDG